MNSSAPAASREQRGRGRGAQPATRDDRGAPRQPHAPGPRRATAISDRHSHRCHALAFTRRRTTGGWPNSLLPQEEHREEQQRRHRLRLAAGPAQLRTARRTGPPPGAPGHDQQAERRGQEERTPPAARGIRSYVAPPGAVKTSRTRSWLCCLVSSERAPGGNRGSRRRTGRTARSWREPPASAATSTTVTAISSSQGPWSVEPEQAEHLGRQERQQQGRPVRAQPLYPADGPRGRHARSLPKCASCVPWWPHSRTPAIGLGPLFAGSESSRNPFGMIDSV